MAVIYATLAQIKAAITDNSGTGQGFPTKGDTNMTQLENAAAKTIDKWCSRSRPRTFAASGDTTRTFNVLDKVIGRTLSLDADLCSITTVLNDTATVSGAGYKLIADPKFSGVYNKIKLLATDWAYATSVYPDDAASITGKFAFSATPPDDIVRATIMLTVALWRQRHTTANVHAATIGADGTIVFPDGLPKAVIDLLEPYVV
jgi:hypothetical protein